MTDDSEIPPPFDQRIADEYLGKYILVGLTYVDGEVLREDFLRPAGLSVNALAKALHVPTPRINDVVRERRGVTADTALRLARYFGGDAQSWLNLQAVYDLPVAEIANRKKIEREVSPIDRDLGALNPA